MFKFAVLLLVTGTFAVPSHRGSFKVDPSGNVRIVGGYTATDGQFPYQVSIRLHEGHYCGGAILDATTVISAAHCFVGQSPSAFTVVTGSTQLSQGGDIYPVSAIRLHEWYNTVTQQHDIAILKLSKSIIFNNRVDAITLQYAMIDKGVHCIASGWGRLYFPGPFPDDLQYVHLYSVRHDDCQKALSGSIVFDSQLCTFTQAGQGTCNGDSGGPLAANGQLAGIVSWGRPCAIGFPDVFTRISYYIDWIEYNRY